MGKLGIPELLFLLLFLAALYLLPTIIAVAHKKRNAGAIAALNIFLGWSGIAWIIALIWALTADQPQQVVIVQPTQPRLCPHCGRYSAQEGQFCQHCGRGMQIAG